MKRAKLNNAFFGRLCCMIPLGLVFFAASAGGAEPSTGGAPGRRQSEVAGALGRKFPEEIVLVVSQGKDGRANIMTAGWAMIASGDPASLAVSIAKERHTHGLIMQTKQFVVAFPGADLEKEMLFCGTRSGRDVDKFAETGLTAVPGKKVKPPLIDECIANFECEMTHAVDVGSHTIFVGKILQSWEHENAGKMRRIYSMGGLKGLRFSGLPEQERDPAAAPAGAPAKQQ